MCDIIGQVVSQAISRRGSRRSGDERVSALSDLARQVRRSLWRVFEAISLLINKCFHRLSLSTKTSLIPRADCQVAEGDHDRQRAEIDGTEANLLDQVMQRPLGLALSPEMHKTVRGLVEESPKSQAMGTELNALITLARARGLRRSRLTCVQKYRPGKMDSGWQGDWWRQRGRDLSNQYAVCLRFHTKWSLIVAEANGGPTGAAPSSDVIADNGTLQVVSASIPTEGAAPCWDVVTSDGRFAIVTMRDKP